MISLERIAKIKINIDTVIFLQNPTLDKYLSGD